MSSSIPSESARIAVVVSRYNREITDGLVSGAREYLASQGIRLAPDDIIDAPGAFEIPLIAKAAAESGRYDGVICLGCVIKGDTAHFEYISLGVATGIMTASLATRTPITFGILMTYTEEQALARTRPGEGNKGREAARACFESIQALRRLGIRSWHRSVKPLTESLTENPDRV